MAEKLQVIIDSKANLGAFNSFLSKLPSLKTLAVGAGAAVGGMGIALLAITKSTANAYDKIQKFSDQLGISTEFLSKMQTAADFSGVKIQTMNKSIQMLTVRMGEAARGIGQGKEAFEDVGIAIYDANGNLKTAEQLMPELADGFKNMANATEKAEAASKIFGQRGIEMLQMFKGGKEGLAKMTDEAERFGLVVSAKAGANAAAFNDSLTRLTGSFKGLKNYIAEQVMPTITALANRMADWVADNRDKILEFGKTFISTMGKAFEYGAYGVAGLIDAWRGLKMVFEVLKIGLSSFAGAMVETLSFLTDKLLAFMEAANIGGVFDGAIESVQGFLQINKDVIYALEQTGQTAYANINKIASEGLAIDKVAEFTQQAKDLLAELSAEGDVKPKAIRPFTDANIKQTKDNAKKLRETIDAAYKALDEMWIEQNTTEYERLNTWYESQQELFTENEEALTKLKSVYLNKRQKLIDADHKKEITKRKQLDAQKKQLDILRFQAAQTALGQLASAAKVFGKKGFRVWKALAIAEATIGALMGAGKTMGEYAYPYNLILAAASLIAGMANVAKIAGTSYPSAHGGLTNVPKEQTYLLNRGERVLSPNQNKDLTQFMGNQEPENVGEQNNYVTVHVLENATSADMLMDMSKEDWNQVVEDKIIPSLNSLAQIGLKPVYS